jgi:hypothetical protein
LAETFYAQPVHSSKDGIAWQPVPQKLSVALEDLLVLRLFQVSNEPTRAARPLPITDWLTEAIWESN